MAVFIASLNSGSNGNCYYVGDGQDAILIDAGITCREVERRMQRLGLDINRIRAIFISHEHTDHISGLPVIARKYGVPVYMTDETFRHAHAGLSNDRVMFFRSGLPTAIGGLSVKAFPKQHDACDPHSFVVSSAGGIRIGVFTDIGYPCRELVYHFRQCHAAFLEANYDEAMLMNGKYPYFLKNRIRGGSGHLSNAQAFQLFTGHRPEFMSHLLLSHLSRENNCPRLVSELFNAHAGDTRIIIASRDQETPVFEINGTFQPVRSEPVRQSPQVQLRLF